MDAYPTPVAGTPPPPTPPRSRVDDDDNDGYLDVRAEELDDLLSALSRTPEVNIRAAQRGQSARGARRTPKTEARPLRREARTAMRSTRSASATPARRKAVEGIQAKVRSGNSVEDLLRSHDKTELVDVACDLLDYIVGRSKILKHEKLLLFSRSIIDPDPPRSLSS